MEDTEMTPAEDLPAANLQKQDPPAPAPALAQNGNTSTDGNLHKLPPADDIQFPPSHDNDAIAAATAAAPPHKGDTGDARALLQTQPNLSPPLPQKKHSASKSKHDSAAKSKRVWTDLGMGDADESGTPEEQDAFMREVETFYRDNGQELKPPKFYGEPLNLLKLWRAVIKLGGYDVVTASKLWRQVGESFHPPKTCTTVSWTFRIFYEKALLEFEKHKRQIGELQLPGSPPHPHQSACAEKETSGNHKTSSGRARRDAATRAMKIWNSPRVAGYGEASEPVVQDKNSNSAPRREKPLKSIDCLRLVKSNQEHAEKPACIEADKEVDTEIADAGQPADWVKINVREAKDCYEIYALVPGLLREEVRVQSDPAGRLVITGQPEQLDNPWGIKPFKKIITLPSKIDPLQTSAVVSLHGRLYVRVPFEQGSA